MEKLVRIGCSAYNNKYWKGVFYPENLPQSQWFGYYCQHFDTYEINGTFYRFPTLETMQNWYNQAPSDFLYSVKVPKEITHLKQLVGCEKRIAQFYEICREGLREKLQYFLFQLPPSYEFTQARLRDVIHAMDKNYSNVVEFRHQSWWVPQVWQALHDHGIVFCSVSYPNLPSTVFTAYPQVYVRLHGVPKLFYSSYASAELIRLQQTIAQGAVTNATVFFNNTAGIHGIENAMELSNRFG